MKTPEQIREELFDILGDVAAPFPAPEWAVEQIIELFNSNRLYINAIPKQGGRTEWVS